MVEIVCILSEHTRKVVRAQKGEEEIQKGDLCLVESEFGGDLAEVIDDSSPVCQYLKASEELPKIIRKATVDDQKKFKWLREKERKAFNLCLQRIKDRGLSMKLTAVRYFFNEKKGIFFYTADGRIDFRQLVKDLAKELKMRIEMRQIGVRDEAKIIGGIGVCGRPLCCVSFMKTFEPVTIQKARKQQIVINPTKISGLCGRLMCCLAFEEESRGRMYAEEEKLIED
ncbi:MAG: regulatory iron-sulfur-containing complex subunit RicT [Candidatus Aminicenantales bacterium]